MTVQFTDIRGAIYHLLKGLENSKDSVKPCINKIVKDYTIKLKASENEQIVLEYTYSKSKLTISGSYEVKNRYGNVVSTWKLVALYLFCKSFLCATYIGNI